MTREVLNDLVDKWEQLAHEARERGQVAHDGWPPGYWYGVAQGYEMAAADLRAATEEDGENGRSR